MKIKRDSSTSSAQRFLELRSGRRIKSPAVASNGQRAQPRSARPASTVPECWRFVEKHMPGCYAAWVAQVGVDATGYTLGISGRPYEVVAIDSEGSRYCRYYSWHKGWTAWRSMPRGPRDRPSSAAPGPQIEEHW